MVYQPSWIISCKIYPGRRIVVVLFNLLAGRDKGVHAFPKCVCLKVNVKVRLEFKLVYYDVAIQDVNQYTSLDNLTEYS